MASERLGKGSRSRRRREGLSPQEKKGRTSRPSPRLQTRCAFRGLKLPRYFRPQHLFVRPSTSRIGFKGAFSLKGMQEVSNIWTLFNGNPFFPPLSLPLGGGPEPSLLR